MRRGAPLSHCADKKNSVRAARKYNCIIRTYLSAAAARLAVSAAMFGVGARCGKHGAAVTSLGRGAAVGADNLVVKFFYEFFKLLPAGRALILQNGHFTFYPYPYVFLCGARAW